MSRISYLFLFLLFFFSVGCTPSTEKLTTITPVGYSAPVKLAALTPVQDDRTWEEKAEAIMKIAESEALSEEAKQTPVAKVTPPAKVAKVKGTKTKKVAKAHKSKARQANQKIKKRSSRVAINK